MTDLSKLTVAELRQIIHDGSDIYGPGSDSDHLAFAAALDELARKAQANDALRSAAQWVATAERDLQASALVNDGLFNAKLEQLQERCGDLRDALAAAAPAPSSSGAPAPDVKSVAERMLDRWRERRSRCLSGVSPAVAEIEAAMSSWSTEVVVQKGAPEGSAMRRAIDAADGIIGRLWKHVESLRERFDYEMEQRDELHASYVRAVDERDVARSALLKIASKVGVTYLADYTTEAAGPVSAIIGAIVAVKTREHEARKQLDMLLAEKAKSPAPADCPECDGSGTKGCKPTPVAPVTDAEVEAAIVELERSVRKVERSKTQESMRDADLREEAAQTNLRALIARRVAEARGAGLRELRARLLSTAASFPNRQMGHSDEGFDRGYVEACENWAQEIDRLLAAPPASTTENAKLRELLVWADGWSRDDKHGPEFSSAFRWVAQQIRFLLGESGAAAPPASKLAEEPAQESKTDLSWRSEFADLKRVTHAEWLRHDKLIVAIHAQVERVARRIEALENNKEAGK